MAYSWRLEAFLDPSESAVGFEVMNNLYMIHSGGLFGRGIGGTYGVMENGDTLSYIQIDSRYGIGWGAMFSVSFCIIVLENNYIDYKSA